MIFVDIIITFILFGRVISLTAGSNSEDTVLLQTGGGGGSTDDFAILTQAIVAIGRPQW